MYGCGATENSDDPSGHDRDAGVADAALRYDDGGLVFEDAAIDNLDAGAAVDLDGPNQLLYDRHFRRGFAAKDAVTGAIVGNLSPGFVAGAPQWNLGQWGSLSNMAAATPTTLPSGAVSWQDSYGAVTIGSPDGSQADLSFRVNALEEYGGVYYSGPNQVRNTWVHLLGEQLISSPGAPGPGSPPISELSSLPFSVDSRLLVDERNLRAGHNPNQHAAQYLMYFTVQNLNMASAGYGDYLWFGLSFYDDRDSRPGLYVNGDDATGKLIYNIGLAPLAGPNVNNGQWHHLSEDLLPHIRLALQEAWSRGYLAASQNMSDYRIGGMNLGWEIPGLNNTELELDNLSLLYTIDTPEEQRFDFLVNGNLEGWTAVNAQTTPGSPMNGLWELTVPGADPALLSPPLNLQASSISSLAITLANAGNPAAGAAMQVFWSVAGGTGFSEANSVAIAISNDGNQATYTFDMSVQSGWVGQISQIRIDPIAFGDGNKVIVDSVVLTP